MKRKIVGVLFRLALKTAPLVGVLLLWDIVCRYEVFSPAVLPSPERTWDTLLRLISNGKLVSSLTISFERVIKGFLIGTTSGIIVGIIMGLSRIVNNLLSSLVEVLRPIPMIAWIPLLILWLGIGEPSKIAVIALGGFWPTLLNTIHGIRSADSKLLEVADILEKNSFEKLIKVVLPSAFPSIFTGFRLGMGVSWSCVVAAEMIASHEGIGYMITFARELSQPDGVMIGMLAIGIFGLIIDSAIRFLQRKLLKWY
ncbi:MAG: ABC transporter permease [Deferribacteraceae bacterium]|jgi:sulfonate transport system permease protein|nr:ABC transporter permease [Deferribacteraceae bacterium]